ncbi:MAG: TolC family protein [Candidatus Omnitrophota bacterium]
MRRRREKNLKNFLKKKQIELIKKESKPGVSKVREQAEQRIDSTKELEAAYKKLKAESEISTIPVARAKITEQSLYKDISIPSDIKPVIRRVTLSDKVSSLEDCLNLAMSKNLPLQIAKEQELLAKLRVREARRAFYPAFLAEWNETDGNTVSEPYRGRSYGLQTEQPLFTGGKLTATLRKEQLGEIIARGNLDRIKQDIIMQINKTYFEFVLAKNTLDIMKRLEIREKELLNQLEKEFAIESATTADFLTAQSFYNQVCFEVANYERAVALAKLALEKELTVENLDVSNLSYHIKRSSIKTNLNECLDLAFRNRPEILILERTIEAAKYTQDIVKSEEMPNVSLQGSYGRSGESFSQRDLNLATEWSIIGKVRWFLGGNTVESSYKKDKISPYKVTKTDTNVDSQTLNTKFSFWDNLAHFTQKKEAQITRKQALKDLEEQKNKIREETEDSYYSYLKYKTQLSLSINEIGFRRKQLEIANTKRSMNEAAVTEVMDAEMKLAQANASMQEALGGINISITNLNRAIGVVNYFHEL